MDAIANELTALFSGQAPFVDAKVTSNKESLRPLDLSISNASKERDKQR
jgi:hypothetical protein